MLNISHLVTSRQTFRVELTRKPTTNEGQNIRRQVEYVKAYDKTEARKLALEMPHNDALRGRASAACEGPLEGIVMRKEEEC